MRTTPMSGAASPPLNEGPETIAHMKVATASTMMGPAQTQVAGRWSLASQLWHQGACERHMATPDTSDTELTRPAIAASTHHP